MPDIGGVSREQAVYKARILGTLEGKDPMELLAAAPGRLDSLLRSLPEAELSRSPAPGKWSVRDMARYYAGHDINHIRQIEAILHPDDGGIGAAP